MSLAQQCRLSVIPILVALILVGCASPQGDTAQDKRASVQAMRDNTLATLYADVPHLRDKVAASAGYGVFSGVATHTVYVASGRGYGVIRNNATGQDTYMRVAKLGGGLGVGAEDVRALVIFKDAQTMNDIIENGWSATGKAATSATVDEKGASAVAVANLPGMEVYRFAKNGMMLSGAVEGVKLWKDDELN